MQNDLASKEFMLYYAWLPLILGSCLFSRHSSTLINDQMVVFGGWDAPISYSDLHILDMSKYVCINT